MFIASSDCLLAEKVGDSNCKKVLLRDWHNYFVCVRNTKRQAFLQSNNSKFILTGDGSICNLQLIQIDLLG